MPVQERRFNPYTENGGTILAIAGQDFCVIAGDTRQSEGYSIQTRYAPKVFRLYVYILNFTLVALGGLTKTTPPMRCVAKGDGESLKPLLNYHNILYLHYR